MTYKLNPFTGKLDTSDGPQGPAGVVSAAGPGSQGTPSISFAADLDTGLYNYTPNGIAVSTGGAGRLFVDASGRLYLGTTAAGSVSADDFTIGGSGARGITIRSGTSSAGGIHFSDGTSGDSQFKGIIAYDHGGDYMRFYTNAQERLRIDSSGRLLVGTSTSRGDNTTVQIVNDSANQLELFRGQSNAFGPTLILSKSRGSTASPTVVSGGDDVGTIVFRGYSGAASDYLGAARIEGQIDGTPDSGGDTTDMPGRLVFSTTADGASTPTERMRIANDGASNFYTDTSVGVRTARTVASAGIALAVYGSATSTTTGTLGFYVLSNGNVENTNDSYGAISDIKLKENIVDAGSQWDDFKAVRFRKYNFKEETGYETHTQLGVIAQELELVSPGLVYETPDQDEEGNDLGTTTKAVKSSILVKKALVALQEAMERIEALEAKVNALEGN